MLSLFCDIMGLICAAAWKGTLACYDRAENAPDARMSAFQYRETLKPVSSPARAIHFGNRSNARIQCSHLWRRTNRKDGGYWSR